MNLFVASFFGLIAISIAQSQQSLQQIPKDLDTQESSPQKYEYKEVILYLTPIEMRALERSNVLQKSNNEYYSNYINNQLPAKKEEEVRKIIQQSIAPKPIHEPQEETTEKNRKHFDIPILYPFQLIPLNDNKQKELEKENEKRWIEEIKKQLKEERENAKIENDWNPIPLKQNTQQIKRLLQNENKVKPTPDYLQLLHAANNFDNKDVLKVQDFYRLQYELDEINKRNHAEDLPRHASLKAQQPLFLYQSQQLKGAPAHLIHATRPQEDIPVTLVGIEKHHHLHEKTIFDTRKTLALRDLHREY